MNKKGFTLIELLAVIIILAVIALIATPVVLNVVENARLEAAKNSAYGLIDAAKYEYSESILKGESKTSGNAADLVVSGTKASAGTWSIDTNGVITLSDDTVIGEYNCHGTVNDMTCTKVENAG